MCVIQRMKINRSISEKVIGIALIIWSCTILYFTFTGLKQLFEISNLSWEEISIFKVIKNYRFQIFIPILSIISGVLLIMNKRIGWIGSVVMSFVYGLGIIIYSCKTYNAEITISNLILPIVISLLFLVLGLVLLNNVFREKYRPSKYTWIIMALTIALLCVDHIFIK